MFVTHLELTNFRCFLRKHIDFDSKVIVIEGLNGSGKTSLLEALHYACYLRSFRTHSPRDLLAFGTDTFSLKVTFDVERQPVALTHQLHIGYTSKKRLVKLNDKALYSYKELMDHFRIVTITEDDLAVIKGSPEVRRGFLDQALLLYHPEYLQLLKEYKVILENRNRLLQVEQINQTMYQIWSEQLWLKSCLIQDQRIQLLHLLQQEVNVLLELYFGHGIRVECTYQPKLHPCSSWQHMLQEKKNLLTLERRFRRSLFGAHLDDVIITFQGAASRMFASRGQQKLVLLLIKIAQLKVLDQKRGAALFLLDDFITDFDEQRSQIALTAITGLKSQSIFTLPIKSSHVNALLHKIGAQSIDIST